MVCQGTRPLVLHELVKLGFKYKTFEFGELDFEENLSQSEIKDLARSLNQYGLELRIVENKLVSKIR